MLFFRHFTRLATLELRLISSPRYWAAALAVVACIPAIYLLIYFSSMWNPAAHTRSLKVGLVNLDKGYTYRQQGVEMGADLVARLMQKQEFGYLRIDNADQAHRSDRARAGAVRALVVVAVSPAVRVPERLARIGSADDSAASVAR